MNDGPGADGSSAPGPPPPVAPVPAVRRIADSTAVRSGEDRALGLVATTGSRCRAFVAMVKTDHFDQGRETGLPTATPAYRSSRHIGNRAFPSLVRHDRSSAVERGPPQPPQFLQPRTMALQCFLLLDALHFASRFRQLDPTLAAGVLFGQ
ncbi:hypothetical protein SAMN04487905_11085 [Actinopolyspora xinjiangensis]|uniref:Uncharacterized protein n=1 Tax=Actinopolyspora xinjiangensis TaxID=405564 RepID=A0A1H0W0W0_9ACTN|nr:hypothetical protein SAMN04487905_11085 [Actinopolyspora xinjiangensis]